MTEQYSQNIDVAVSRRAKATQYIGIAAVLLSVGFIFAAAFYNWYLMFAFAAFLAIGAIEIHVYNATPREYIYDFSPKRLVVAKKDVVNRTRRILSVLYEDVASFAPLEGLSEESDLVCCSSAGEEGVYELNFKAGDSMRRLVFKPDEYLTQLIKSALASANKDESQEG